MRGLSCGILVKWNNKLLMGHPTYSIPTHWNIPKGHIEEGETPMECARRETWEEVNLVIWSKDLIDLGRFDYIPEKDLWLFGTTLTVEPKNIKCNSYFKNKQGEEIPEFNDFKFVNIDELKSWTSNNLYNTITLALKKWKENENK